MPLRSRHDALDDGEARAGCAKADCRFRAVLARQPGQQLALAIDEVQSILAGPSIQARCLECVAAEPARPLNRRDLSLLELLKAWLG